MYELYHTYKLALPYILWTLNLNKTLMFVYKKTQLGSFKICLIYKTLWMFSL